MKQIDISKIFVYDDVFPDYLVQSFSKKLNDCKRWEYGIQGRKGGSKDGRFFAIWVHRPHEQTEDPFNLDVDGIASYVHDAFTKHILQTFIPDAYANQLYRVHFNGQVPMDVAVPIHLVNTFGLPFNSGTILAGLVIISLFYFSLGYTRKKNWVNKEPEFTSGTLWKYMNSVGPAYLGAVSHPGGKLEKKTYSDI